MTYRRFKSDRRTRCTEISKLLAANRPADVHSLPEQDGMKFVEHTSSFGELAEISGGPRTGLPEYCWVTPGIEDDSVAAYPAQSVDGPEISFAMLVHNLDDRRRTERLSESECSNLKSTARRLMTFFGLVDGDSVTPSLAGEFEASLKRFERLARNPPTGMKGLGAKSVPGYVSRLRSLNRIVVEMLGNSETFTTTLNRAADRWVAAGAKRSLTKLAELSGIKRETLLTWKKGRVPTPTPRSYAQVDKLEDLLSLQPGSLRKKVVDYRSGNSSQGKAAIFAEANAPGKLPDYTRVKYIPVIKQLPHALFDFYGKLAEYKTSRFPGRTIDGRALRRGKRVNAANEEWMAHFHTFMGAMIGWLTLPATIAEARVFVHANMRGSFRPDQIDQIAPYFVGAGLCLGQVGPCHLVDPALVGKFLEWKKKRAGTESQYHQSFFTYVMALTKPIEGFLWQQPEFSWAYLDCKPIGVTDLDWRKQYKRSLETWTETCSEWHAQLKDMSHDVNKHAKSRDPKIELAAILTDDTPMRHIFGIIRQHAAQRKEGSLEASAYRHLSLAAWWRDDFLLRLLATNPLRSHNLQEMTWKEDNTGDLYRRGNCWRIRFHPSAFKNVAGAARHAYDVPTASMLTPVIDTYIKRARPLLLRGKHTDAVFLTQLGTPYAGSTMTNHVDNLSRPYRLVALPSVKAIRCHAYRHIIATSWLKAHPEQYRAVASILHDKLETVLKNYDHSDPAQGLIQWTECRCRDETPQKCRLKIPQFA